MIEGVQIAAADNHDGAAAAAVAAGGTTSGHVLLATEGDAAIPTPPAEDLDSGLVNEVHRCLGGLYSAAGWIWTNFPLRPRS